MDKKDSEESEFSSSNALSYINQLLMEEDTEEKYSMLQDSLALQNTEKSFYEVINQSYPSSSSSVQPLLHNVDTPETRLSGSSTSSGLSDYSTFSSGTSYTTNSPESQWSPVESIQPILPTTFPDPNFVVSQPSLLGNHPMPPFLDSSTLVTNCNSEYNYLLQFQRGVEQGTSFLPQYTPLLIHPDNPSFFPMPPYVVIKTEPECHQGEHFLSISKGKWEEFEAESQYERSRNKECMDGTELSELFDKVLLGTGFGKGAPPNDESNMNTSGKSIVKQGNNEQVVDLRTLLMLCAQAVASDNHSFANQLLKQIKQQASPTGDGTQRLAHYFGNAFEARLAGTGFKIYSVLSSKRASAAELIKAYQVYASVCPFEKLAIIFANNSIWNLAKEAETLHIIDFGILHGFKWPALINRISKRVGGPPKLRITGIELPQPCFKPEETENRLASYCKRFNVPFEFNLIAEKRWETIKVEDLKIEENEFVAVNCLLRFENLLDGTVVLNNPRDAVLSLIKKANPGIFVHGIVSGGYNVPFFVTRFKEAFFHYSALFDMLDTTVDSENPKRLMFEKEVFGREVMNTIACEGCDRVERPESYKQWQLRNMRNGFRQLPMDNQIIDKLKDRLRDDGHNTNFNLEVDGNWLLQGWKGRILQASSCWVPT